MFLGNLTIRNFSANSVNLSSDIPYCLSLRLSYSDLFKFSMRSYPNIGSYLIYPTEFTFSNRQKAKDMDKGLMYFYFAPRIMLSKENYLYSFLTLAGTYSCNWEILRLGH